MKRTSWGMAAVVLAIGLLYTLSMFPGLEYHSAYFGHTYKALHPESFPGDKYMPTDSPSGGSSFYWLARLFGELWLDDRFTLFLFFLLVIFALVGVDRTARAFGVHRMEERLTLLALMAMGHRFRDNFANLVENSDFYAGTFAGVAAIWLFALYFSEAPLWQTGLTAAILWSLTPRWGWFPILIVLAWLFKERLTPVAKRQVILCLPLFLAAGWGIYWLWLRPADGTDPLLFDHLLQMENSEVHPFLDRSIGNLKFFLLTGLGWILPPAGLLQAGRIRLVALLGALLWLGGGIYLSYAPEFLKIPYLVPFAFNRALQWPQYLLFLSLSVVSIQRIGQAAGTAGLAAGTAGLAAGRERLLYLALLMALYGTFFLHKIAIMALLWSGVLILWAALSKRKPGQMDWVRVSAAAFLGVTLAAYGGRALKRAPHLKFMVQQGVIGDNPSAKWVGVDRFIRDQTAPDAVLLPIATRDYLWRPGVKFEGSLRTRTGRTMPVGSPWPVLFKVDLLKSLDEEGKHLDRLIAAWKERDPTGVSEEFGYFRRMGYDFDYLVVENSEADWVRDGRLSYLVEKVIGNFTILRRSHDSEITSGAASSSRSHD